TGAIAIERAVKGLHQVAAFAALLTLPSMPFSLGLANFQFGLGIALFGIASWIACEHQKWRLRFGVHALFVVVLFVAHLFALGVYGLTLGLYELRRIFAARFNIWAATTTVLTLASPVLVMLAVVHRSGGALGGTENEWLFSWKPVWFALLL